MDKSELKNTYEKLNKTAAKLCSDLNGNGFDSEIDWVFDSQVGYPTPVITLGGKGTVRLDFEGGSYEFTLNRKKALRLNYGKLGKQYKLTVYGIDNNDLYCTPDSDPSETAFAISGSNEAFYHIELAFEGQADILMFRKILADSENVNEEIR